MTSEDGNVLCINYDLTCDFLPNCAKLAIPNPDENCISNVRSAQCSQSDQPLVAGGPGSSTVTGLLPPHHIPRPLDSRLYEVLSQRLFTADLPEEKF